MYIIHDAPQFHIYFGDAADALYPDVYHTWQEVPILLEKPTIKPVVKRLHLDTLFFLHQVHGMDGYTISPSYPSLQPFSRDGDYLVTNQPAVGLGIMTADCLPVIAIDKKNDVIGIAHAGWRGAHTGVVQAMLKAMQNSWQTQLSDCQFFLGPSARDCCYQVGEEFTQILKVYPWHHHIVQKKQENYFLNLPLFIRYQLRDLAIADDAIEFMYNICTICNDRFFSYRRGMITNTIPLVGRQMTIVALKKADG